MSAPAPSPGATASSSQSLDSVSMILADSASGEQYATSSETESLVEGLKNYIYENGRKYHSYRAGRYPFPCDETEQDRLDLWHHVNIMMNNGEYHTEPLKPNTKRILDLGTGTGIWAIEMADKHPDIQFTSVDLSPIQPSLVPPNVQFLVDDIEDEWVYHEGFDFIHCRGMAQSIYDWPKLLRQAFKQLNPGGIMQLCETESSWNSDDNSIPPDSALWVFQETFYAALERRGTPDPCRYLAQYMRAAGFVDVKVVRKKVPWGPWPKDPQIKSIGAYSLAMLETGFRAFGLALFTRGLGMTEEEANSVCDAAYRECRNRSVHAYNFQWHVSGKRPEYNIASLLAS